jgi:hypothetical protein
LFTDHAVSEEKIFKNLPIRNKNCLWRPCLFVDWDEMSSLYRGPSIDATSYGKLTVKLPLGNKQKFTNFAIANKAFKDSHKMDLGAPHWYKSP